MRRDNDGAGEEYYPNVPRWLPYEENKEARNAASRKYYEENKESILAKKKAKRKSKKATA